MIPKNGIYFALSVLVLEMGHNHLICWFNQSFEYQISACNATSPKLELMQPNQFHFLQSAPQIYPRIGLTSKVPEQFFLSTISTGFAERWQPFLQMLSATGHKMLSPLLVYKSHGIQQVFQMNYYCQWYQEAKGVLFMFISYDLTRHLLFVWKRKVLGRVHCRFPQLLLSDCFIYSSLMLFLKQIQLPFLDAMKQLI